tara:strand:+ start:903 stop:1361 length:459 start_codon:yes stop_codon:yes gene_type:complete
MITYVSDKVHSYFYRDNPKLRNFKYSCPSKEEISSSDAWIDDLTKYGWEKKPKPPGKIYHHVLMFYASIEITDEDTDQYYYEYNSSNIIWAYNGLDEISSNGKAFYSFKSKRRLIYKDEQYDDLGSLMNLYPEIFKYKPLQVQQSLFELIAD